MITDKNKGYISSLLTRSVAAKAASEQSGRLLQGCIKGATGEKKYTRGSNIFSGILTSSQLLVQSQGALIHSLV